MGPGFLPSFSLRPANVLNLKEVSTFKVGFLGVLCGFFGFGKNTTPKHVWVELVSFGKNI